MFDLCSELTESKREHESQLSGVENQQLQMLENVRKEAKIVENQRRSLVNQLEEEKKKLELIEARIANLTGGDSFSANDQSDQIDPMLSLLSESSSDDDLEAAKNNNDPEKNRNSLSKLERLDQSLEADLNRISVIESDRIDLNNDREEVEFVKPKVPTTKPPQNGGSLKNRFKDEFFSSMKKQTTSNKKKSSTSSTTTSSAGTNTKSLNSVGASDESVSGSRDSEEINTER